MNSAPRSIDMTRCGFPHSEIHGSTLACSSPWLFAANHVLHRLLAPRHPPNALTSLTTKSVVAPDSAGQRQDRATQTGGELLLHPQNIGSANHPSARPALRCQRPETTTVHRASFVSIRLSKFHGGG